MEKDSLEMEIFYKGLFTVGMYLFRELFLRKAWDESVIEAGLLSYRVLKYSNIKHS